MRQQLSYMHGKNFHFGTKPAFCLRNYVEGGPDDRWVSDNWGSIDRSYYKGGGAYFSVAYPSVTWDYDGNKIVNTNMEWKSFSTYRQMLNIFIQGGYSWMLADITDGSWSHAEIWTGLYDCEGVGVGGGVCQIRLDETTITSKGTTTGEYLTSVNSDEYTNDGQYGNFWLVKTTPQ